MKLKTLLIDDEPIALEKLRNYSAKVPFLEIVGVCKNGIEATDIISHENIDVIFTDINMPDMSGMDFISSLTSPPLVVFITAYTDYAIDSYRLSAVDYLLKPYSFADFQRAANKVLNLHNLKFGQDKSATQESTHNAADDSLFVKVDYKFMRIKPSDIQYIKGYGEYLQIYTVVTHSPIVILSSFNSLKSKLPDNFLQVHRSYMVNMNVINSICKNRITMDTNIEIPIGDSYKDALQSYLSSHSIGLNQKK